MSLASLQLPQAGTTPHPTHHHRRQAGTAPRSMRTGSECRCIYDQHPGQQDELAGRNAVQDEDGLQHAGDGEVREQRPVSDEQECRHANGRTRNNMVTVTSSRITATASRPTAGASGASDPLRALTRRSVHRRCLEPWSGPITGASWIVVAALGPATGLCCIRAQNGRPRGRPFCVVAVVTGVGFAPTTSGL